MTELARLRFTGAQAQTFQYPSVGHVEPGGEFSVPAEALLSFMRRPDIEHAGECPAPPCRCGEESEPEPTAPRESENSVSGKAKGARRSAVPSTQDAQD